jgi:hypothetical protein
VNTLKIGCVVVECRVGAKEGSTLASIASSTIILLLLGFELGWPTGPIRMNSSNMLPEGASMVLRPA